MHQARLSIAVDVSVVWFIFFLLQGATLPSGFVETTVASGLSRPQQWQCTDWSGYLFAHKQEH